MNRKLLIGIIYVLISAYFLVQIYLGDYQEKYPVPLYVALGCLVYGVYNLAASLRHSETVRINVYTTVGVFVIFFLGYQALQANIFASVAVVAILSSVVFNRGIDIKNMTITLAAALLLTAVIDYFLLRQVIV